jgi:hypothetical protein
MDFGSSIIYTYQYVFQENTQLSFIRFSFLLAFFIQLAAPLPLSAAALSAGAETGSLWSSANVKHAYGFPDAKANAKGALTLSRTELRFADGTANASIRRDTITAVSAGDDRVELWGTGGRIMRMAIPDGGGLAAGAFMHHRVDMLTVEFNDSLGGTHAAVFYLPAHEAAQALSVFSQLAYAHRAKPASHCDGPIDAGSVLVREPDWNRAEVPAAYRALLYEHVIDRLRHTKDIGRVYREGEVSPSGGCPQSTVRISVEVFKQGNQVKRAAMGPVGMFVGTTRMSFAVSFTDASGQLHVDQGFRP